jgi:hypothetical protein
MEYECQVISASSLTSTFNKVVSPLCSKCKNVNCTNPIVEKKISVFGKVHTTRLFNGGHGLFVVTKCDGFLEEGEEYDI